MLCARLILKLLARLLPELYSTQSNSVVQAATILVAMASGKNIWRPKFQRKSPTNRLKKKLTWKIINNRTNLINSTSGGITCLSLSPISSFRNLTWMRKHRPFGTLALCVISHEVSSASGFFFFFADQIFFYGEHFRIEVRLFCDFSKKWAWGAVN